MVDAKDTFAFAGELAKLRVADLRVDPQQCVHVRNRAASCERCAQVCPRGAIAFRGGLPGKATFQVVPDLCERCGTCARTCPTGALCAGEGDGFAADARIASEVALGVGAAAAPAHVGVSGILPQQVPAARKRLLDALESGQANGGDVPVSWGRLSIDVDACRACRMCAVFCPTGALSRYEVHGERGLQHQPSKCVDCRLCEDACQVGAITVHHGVAASKLRRNAVVRYPLPQPAWLPTGTNQIREKMRGLINTESLG